MRKKPFFILSIGILSLVLALSITNISLASPETCADKCAATVPLIPNCAKASYVYCDKEGKNLISCTCRLEVTGDEINPLECVMDRETKEFCQYGCQNEKCLTKEEAEKKEPGPKEPGPAVGMGPIRLENPLVADTFGEV